IADSENHRIRRIELDGTIGTIAGTGTPGSAGDGGAATAAQLAMPFGVTTDLTGRVVIADTGNQRIRRIGADGTMATVAGDGTPGYSGDGGPATSASMLSPTSVAVDAAGLVVIADAFNHRVRRVAIDNT